MNHFVCVCVVNFLKKLNIRLIVNVTYLTPSNFTLADMLELQTLSSPHPMSKGSKSVCAFFDLPLLLSIGHILQNSRADESLCVKSCVA